MTSAKSTASPRAKNGHVGFVASVTWFQTPAPGAWTRQAACSQFPGLAASFTEVASFEEAATGLTICSDCPVRLACLQYGQRLEADGVWGGQLLSHGRPRLRSVR
jgi:Transcription factor WhiB